MILYSRTPKRSPRVNGMYIGNTSDNQRNQIDRIYREGGVKALQNVLNGYTLEDFQTMLPAIAYISKRFIIGADTGLGKSLMIALYLKIHQAKKTLHSNSRALIITTSASLQQIKGLVEKSTGISVKHLPGDSNKLMKVFERRDLHHYDVFIVSNTVFGQSIEFNRMFGLFKDTFKTVIFDESMSGANPESTTHQSIKHTIRYFEYRLFLNATVIEKKLEQLYYQFYLLEPDLTPPLETLKKLHDNWVRTGTGKKSRRVLKGVKNVDKLLDSMPYHYRNVSRVELNRVFDSEDIPVPLVMTPKQSMLVNGQNYNYVLFSPDTQDNIASQIPFNRENVPALNKTVEIVRKEYYESGGGIVIYAEPTACKDVLRRELQKEIPNLTVGIIDGQDSGDDDRREHTRQSFINGKMDVVIINIPEALDLTSGRVMIVYTLPSKHYQARNRIMRGLQPDGSKKRFYYLVYLNSPQSNYLHTTMYTDEETIANSLNRGITTIRTISKQIRQLERIKHNTNIQF